MRFIRESTELHSKKLHILHFVRPERYDQFTSLSVSQCFHYIFQATRNIRYCRHTKHSTVQAHKKREEKKEANQRYKHGPIRGTTRFTDRRVSYMYRHIIIRVLLLLFSVYQLTYYTIRNLTGSNRYET